MKLAEFIGIDAINSNLENLNFDAIGVYQGKLEKFKKIATDDAEEEDLILAFNQWADRMLQSNPINSQLYAIQLYEFPKEGGKNLRGTTSFTFMLCDKVKQNIQAPAISNNNFISQKELNLALENQRLAFENSLLQKQIEEEEDLEEDEPEEIGAIGQIQNAVMAKLPQLIDMLIAGFLTQSNNNTQSNMNLGIGSNIDDLIIEFKKINPNIENDLAKLLKVAKEKPTLFKMLIENLRAM